MTSERSPDHNCDIAIDLHLNAAEDQLREGEAGSSKRRAEHHHLALDSTVGALRELQLWIRGFVVDAAVVAGNFKAVDGRLRRLEAAASADDLAIDDLRDLIEELRIEVDALLELSDGPRS